jgi:hypothetical protein
MFADDSKLYVSATTASENSTATLNRELQSDLEWVASNKMNIVLNISETKICIWYKSFPKF